MADWHPEQKADWDEYRVVQAFCRWLEAQGWSTEIQVDHVDVVAMRGDDVLYAEVKEIPRADRASALTPCTDNSLGG